MTAPLLVVAHEATRTGSPRVLADLIRHTRDRLPVPLAVRLLATGPLAPELRSLATAEADEPDEPCAVFINSALAVEAALGFDKHVPMLVYVHELGEAIASLPEQSRDALRTRFRRVLCVSTASRDALVGIGVPPEIIRVLPPVVRTANPHPSPRDGSRDVPLVIGCGEASWRKGTDLFVDVAKRVLDTRPARFEWAGRRPRAFARVLDNDTSACGIGEHLTWLGELDDVAPLYDRADLLLLTSREDPSPLVTLEAAQHGVATVGFQLGGLVDLANRAAAAAVPYPDTVALARLTVDLLEDHERRSAMSETAAFLARTEQSVDVVGEQFLEELLSLIPRAGR